MRHRCVLADRDGAHRILLDLLSEHAVEETLKIRPIRDSIAIPVKEDMDFNGRFNITEEEFEERFSRVSPQSLIKKELVSLGLDADNIPEKWVRLGSSVILRLESKDQAKKERVAEAYAQVLKVSSVYEQTGRISGVFREPGINLLYGPGGDTIHVENGIRFLLDPSKVMFSPGNVNTRTSVREMDLRGKTVIDMFAGIGYFSLGIAKYSKPDQVHSVEINRASYGYLTRNVEINNLEDRITTHLGDCRKLEVDIKADLVVMGNFMSGEYLPHALTRIDGDGTLLMHEVVSTESLPSHRYDLQKRIRRFGWNSTVISQCVVKSFSPHMWHTSIEIFVERP